MADTRSLVERFPEINPSNYDHDDACALNAWGIEACAELERLRSVAGASRVDLIDKVNAAETALAASQAREAKMREDVIEECAKVANEFATIRRAMLEVEYAVNERYGGDATVDEFVPIICERIAAALRSLTQEPRRQ